MCATAIRKELLSDCLNKNMKSVGEAKTRVNINIFLSQDVHDENSDNEVVGHAENQAVSEINFVPNFNNQKCEDNFMCDGNFTIEIYRLIMCNMKVKL